MSRLLSLRLGQLSFDYIFNLDGDKIRRLVKFRQICITPDQYLFQVDARPWRLPRGVDIVQMSDDDVMLNLGLTVGKPVKKHLAPGVGFWLVIDREHSLGRVPTFVNYADVANAGQKKNPLSIPVGLAAGRTPVVLDLDKETQANLIVAGAPGGGKSSLLHTLICTLLKQPSDEVNLILVDFKEVEFNAFYHDVPHLRGEITTSPHGFGLRVSEMLEEVMTRYRLMKSKNATHVRKYNARVGKAQRLPRLVMVVDEIAFFMLDRTVSDKAEIESNLARVAQLGRAAGVHLVLCTQRPERSVITGLIHACCPGKIAFACSDVRQSQVVVGNGAAAFTEDVPLGRAVMTHSRFQYQFQAAWISEDMRIQIADDARAGRTGQKVMTHDVTIQELARFALEHWDGVFKQMELFYQFEDRGVTDDDIRDLTKIHSAEPFTLGDDSYILKQHGKRKPYLICKVEDSDTE